MNDAVPMCAPGPGRFGPILDEPSTVPSSSTATAVRDGGLSIQSARPSSYDVSGS